MTAIALATLGLGLASCAHGHSGHKKGDTGLDVTNSFGAVWDDPERCRQAVLSGRKLPRKDGKIRVGTWNIRWFPDGKPGNAPDVEGTDIPWAACAIAFLDVDVLGLQEIKLTDRGKEKLTQLTTLLRELTASSWAWVAEDCPTPSRQHVVILYREEAVTISQVKSHGEIDPTAKTGRPAHCPGDLRPALGAYVKSKHGGADFHFVSTHLDSGRSKRDYKNRQDAFELLGTVHDRRFALTPDDDLIVAADFNLMGCKDCEAKNSIQEREVLKRTIAALKRPLSTPAANIDCTEYYRGKGYTIDQIVHSTAMAEAKGSAQLVSGVCAAAKCSVIKSEDLPFFRRLSDHCPVVLDIEDRDLD